MSFTAQLTPLVRPLDRALLGYCERHYGVQPQSLEAGLLLLASYFVGLGHTCCHLSTVANQLLTIEETTLTPPGLAEMLTALSQCEAVAHQATHLRPFVLQENRLYLQRYFSYEEEVASAIGPRLSLMEQTAPTDLAPLIPLFETHESLAPFGGDLSAAAALMPRHFSMTIIAGGPGTGKTTTLAKLLSVALTENPQIQIALAAPTGKAAMRMNESLAKALNTLALPKDIAEKLAILQARTIHRLLGSRFLSPHFKHGATQPLLYDLVVLDEASMIDLPMMQKLLVACRPETKLILLGDPFQLASVEAGAVFGDLCDALLPNQFTPQFCTMLAPLVRAENWPSESTTLSPFVELKKSYRFTAESGIGHVSMLIKGLDKGGTPEEILQSLKNQNRCRLVAPERLWDTQLKGVLLPPIKKLAACTTPEEALACGRAFQILTALRQGPQGTGYLQELCLQWAQEENCRYLPIIITANSYEQDLFNGDVGVENPTTREAWFPGVEGVRHFSSLLLPEHESAFAITIHKSQGSEYEEVLIILPVKTSLVLNRELLYTAITRAKKEVTLLASEEIVIQTLQEKTVRHSGLAKKIKGLIA